MEPPLTEETWNDRSMMLLLGMTFIAGVVTTLFVLELQYLSSTSRRWDQGNDKTRGTTMNSSSTTTAHLDGVITSKNSNQKENGTTVVESGGESPHVLTTSTTSTAGPASPLHRMVEVVEDWKLRIGDLPRPFGKRSHWPWENLHKKRKTRKSKQVTVVVTDSHQHDDDTTKHSNASVTNTTHTTTTTNGKHQHHHQQYSDKTELCIGNIFGLDVGGTLAKLVYFEEPLPSRITPSSKAASASHFSLQQQSPTRGHPSAGSGSKLDLASRNLEDEATTTTATTATAAAAGANHETTETLSRPHGLPPHSYAHNAFFGSKAHSFDAHNYSPTTNSLPSSTSSNSFQELLDGADDDDNDTAGGQKQGSTTPTRYDLADDDNDDSPPPTSLRLSRSADYVHEEEEGTTSPRKNGRPRIRVSTSASSALLQEDPNGGAANGTHQGAVAVGRLLSGETEDHHRTQALARFYHFASRELLHNDLIRDDRLRFTVHSHKVYKGGTFHFLHFETRQMKAALDLIQRYELHQTIHQVGATGGGAHKFAKVFDERLGIGMNKADELESLVAGMQFILRNVVGECYTYRPPDENVKSKTSSKPETDNQKSRTNESGVTTDTPVDTNDGGDTNQQENATALPLHKQQDQAVADETPGANAAETEPSDQAGVDGDVETESTASSRPGAAAPKPGRLDEWWWSRKVPRDTITAEASFPYLLVTIGTGVSILRVDGPRKHERISGSTIGGGTYWGLIRLLTSIDRFSEVLRLAEQGDPSKVDMMVGDIYGSNSEALEKLGLREDLVASSFGKLVAKEDPAEGLKEEDLARALLLMVTNNIGQVAYLNAQLHKTSRIYFVGNFLRQNKLSQRRLAFAIDYWSKGQMEALFLEHEGYFGALGAFLLSQESQQNPTDADDDDNNNNNNNIPSKHARIKRRSFTIES